MRFWLQSGAKDAPLALVLSLCPRPALNSLGPPTTVWRRLKRWGEEGVWERTWRAALAALDVQDHLARSMGFLAGSFAPAKNGGEKVGLIRKGKGTKWMLMTDGNGLPLGFHLDSAQVAEVRLAERTLETVAVPRPPGRPRQRLAKLVADRGYDSSALLRGIRMCIPPKLRPAAKLKGKTKPSSTHSQRFHWLGAPIIRIVRRSPA